MRKGAGRRFWMAAALLAAIVGCGPSKVEVTPVQGTVTLDGEPLTNAMIMLENKDAGFAASGMLDGEGRFSLTSQHGLGIPPGIYHVAVSPLPRGQLPPGEEAAEEFHEVPKKYHVTDTSGLTLEVELGGGPYELDLAVVP